MQTVSAGFLVPHVVAWNGTDDRGRLVPASLYVLRLETAASHDSQRVVFVK